MPLMISMIAATLRRAAKRLMSSGDWLIEALLSGCGLAWGYPPQTPASCRPLDRARCCLTTLNSTLSRCFRAYWLSSFCGGRSTCPLLCVGREGNPVINMEYFGIINSISHVIKKEKI